MGCRTPPPAKEGDTSCGVIQRTNARKEANPKAPSGWNCSDNAMSPAMPKWFHFWVFVSSNQGEGNVRDKDFQISFT